MASLLKRAAKTTPRLPGVFAVLGWKMICTLHVASLSAFCVCVCDLTLSLSKHCTAGTIACTEESQRKICLRMSDQWELKQNIIVLCPENV